MGILVILGILVLLVIGHFMFLNPIRKFITLKKNQPTPKITFIEFLALLILPIFGFVSLNILKKDIELFDWKYIHYLYILEAIYTAAYFFSRLKKQNTGPLTIVILTTILVVGVIFLVLLFVHLSFYFVVTAATILIGIGLLGIPLFGIIMSIALLMSELIDIMHFIIDSNPEQGTNAITHIIKNLYKSKYAWLFISITLPLLIIIVPIALSILNKDPYSTNVIVKAFTESHDGIFSNGKCEVCTPPMASEYICTIAAHGSPNLVKPIHIGTRGGMNIPVNRQLKVCNAFEELIAEKYPKVQRFMRKRYDGLQISIEKWKHIKIISNLLYIAIKPLEYTFLIYIYLVDPKPENRIGRQYL